MKKKIIKIWQMSGVFTVTHRTVTLTVRSNNMKLSRGSAMAKVCYYHALQLIYKDSEDFLSAKISRRFPM